jgi:hypothetical protein
MQSILDDCVLMNTRSIAIIITFTALSIVLIPVRVPAISLPNFYYYFWGIPIVAAFLLFNFKVALAVTVLNTLARMAMGVNPNPLILPVIIWAPYLTMLGGVYLANKLIAQRISIGKPISEARKIVYVTALGVAFRGVIMPFVDYANYHTVFPFFLGLNIPEAYIMGIMPGIVIFNILVPLYEVSIGYTIAETARKSLRINQSFAET